MKKPFSGIPYISGGRIVLKIITEVDADSLQELVRGKTVYRYLPAFLYKKKSEDIHMPDKMIQPLLFPVGTSSGCFWLLYICNDIL